MTLLTSKQLLVVSGRLCLYACGLWLAGRVTAPKGRQGVGAATRAFGAQAWLPAQLAVGGPASVHPPLGLSLAVALEAVGRASHDWRLAVGPVAERQVARVQCQCGPEAGGKCTVGEVKGWRAKSTQVSKSDAIQSVHTKQSKPRHSSKHFQLALAQPQVAPPLPHNLIARRRALARGRTDSST